MVKGSGVLCFVTPLCGSRATWSRGDATIDSGFLVRGLLGGGVGGKRSEEPCIDVLCCDSEMTEDLNEGSESGMRGLLGGGVGGVILVDAIEFLPDLGGTGGGMSFVGYPSAISAASKDSAVLIARSTYADIAEVEVNMDGTAERCSTSFLSPGPAGLGDREPTPPECTPKVELVEAFEPAR
jgi:hypothetical protein